MKIKCTDHILAVCQKCCQDDTLSNELVTKASEAFKAGNIEWNDLKQLVATVNASSSDSTLFLHEICQGSQIFLPPPPPKQTKSPELQAHLDRLLLQLEQSQYNKMVWEVIKDEVKAKEDSEMGLHTYKQQMSFGIHVIVMMAAFYVFGHIAGRAMTSNTNYHPVVGLACMFIAMMVETLLYIIRTTALLKLKEEQARPLQTQMKKLPLSKVSRVEEQQQPATTTTQSEQPSPFNKNNNNSRKVQERRDISATSHPDISTTKRRGVNASTTTSKQVEEEISAVIDDEPLVLHFAKKKKQ